jgi:hypothetical protein
MGASGERFFYMQFLRLNVSVLLLCFFFLSAICVAGPVYKAVPEASSQKPDSAENPKLLDGKWHDAATESVQYDGDVSITVDFGTSTTLGVARVRAFQKSGDYQVKRLEAALSDDGENWRKAGSMDNAVPDWKGGDEKMPVDLYVALAGSARYVRLKLTKADDAKRILLGEIMVGPTPEPIGQLDTKLGVWTYEYATMPGKSGEPKTKIKAVAGKVDVYETFDWSKHEPALAGDPTHIHHRVDPIKMIWAYQMPKFEFIPYGKQKEKEDE